MKYVITDEDTGEMITFFDLKKAENEYARIRKEHPRHTLNMVRYTPNYKNGEVTTKVMYSTI